MSARKDDFPVLFSPTRIVSGRRRAGWGFLKHLTFLRRMLKSGREFAISAPGAS